MLPEERVRNPAGARRLVTVQGKGYIPDTAQAASETHEGRLRANAKLASQMVLRAACRAFLMLTLAEMRSRQGNILVLHQELAREGHSYTSDCASQVQRAFKKNLVDSL